MFTLTKTHPGVLFGFAARRINHSGQQHLQWSERLQLLTTYVREDPTVTYDLHAAFSKDPDTVKTEDALDEYTKIQQAAIRAGKRPPKKKEATI